MAMDPDVQRLLVERQYFYATGMERTLHAYTKEEWGIGGAQPSGNYSVHTTTGLFVVTALMTIPALGAPLLLIIALASLNLIVVVFGLLGTALFTGGWLLGAPTDDQARTWFEANPSGIAITRENFPGSTRPFPGEHAF